MDPRRGAASPAVASRAGGDLGARVERRGPCIRTIIPSPERTASRSEGTEGLEWTTVAEQGYSGGARPLRTIFRGSIQGAVRRNPRRRPDRGPLLRRLLYFHKLLERKEG